MRALSVSWITLTLSLLAIASQSPARASSKLQTQQPDLSCTGSAHSRVIALWENSLRNYFRSQINDRLNKNGDVYVLYYTQEELQSFVEMTRACKDRQQISELAEILNSAFTSLRPLHDASNTYGWICKGGHTCTARNHLLGKEVTLCSAQFLGLLGALATDIVETIPASEQSPTEKAFIINATIAMSTQLDHWLSPSYFRWVETRTGMTSADAKDGQSKYFFQDRDLWYMAALSDLAELHQAGIKTSGAGSRAFKSLQNKHGHISSMFNLLLKRITMFNKPSNSRAEIDRGYWRNYADSRYANYSGNDSPILCHKNGLDITQKVVRVKSITSYIDANIGWDFSHAQRLVPAFNTFARNRSNIDIVFGYHDQSFDPIKLRRAFANQIIDKIWNKDDRHPLFSNFWNGKNGWYRAGYENGTGSCRPGQPPYSLTEAFLIGGYIQWGKFNPTIHLLSIQLYRVFHSSELSDIAFTSKYYPSFKMTKGE